MAMPPSPQYSHPSPDNNLFKNNPFQATQLLTPEEPPLDSFNHQSGQSLPSIFSSTEPATPESPAQRSFAKIQGGSFSSQDGVLYPDHNATDANSKPLFEQSGPLPQDPLSPTNAAVHLPTQNVLTPPSSTVVQMYSGDPMAYWRSQMTELEAMRAKQRQARQLPPLQPSLSPERDHFDNKQISRLDKNSRSTLAPKRASGSKDITPSGFKITIASTKVPTGITKQRKPREKASVNIRAVTPESKPRTRAPASKKKEGPNAEGWFQVADVCPPVKLSLDASNVALVSQDSGSNTTRSLDLSNDPDRAHLDSRELALASSLRLPCNMYLLCKRRIFAAKLQALKDGKEFNKTAAQNVCTIDVNKVSKMWTAFNRVGWFDETWFKKHM